MNKKHILNTLILFLIAQGIFSQHFIDALSFGGSERDYASSFTFDDNNNKYITGYFTGTVNFDPNGQFLLTSNGGSDIFIQKLDEDDNLIFATSVGGPGDDIGRSVVVNQNGFIYISGSFEQTVDFSGIGTQNKTSVGGEDAFILRLNNQGQFDWVQTYGGLSDDRIVNSVIDGSKIYTLGNFSQSIDIDPGSNIVNLISNGGSDVFIQKLNQVDGSFQWGYNFGGSLDDAAMELAIKGSNLYMVGQFKDTVDFDLGTGVFNLTALSQEIDPFVVKIKKSTAELKWAITYGGTGQDQAHGVAVDDFGNVYVVGTVFGHNGSIPIDMDPGPNVFDLNTNLWTDGYILKLKSNGDFSWANNIGGDSQDYARRITLDDCGLVHVSGSFSATVDFDPDPLEDYFLTSNGGFDVFNLTLNKNGVFKYANSLGSSDYEQVADLESNDGSLFTLGFLTNPIDFDPSTDVFQLSSNGDFDYYILETGCGEQEYDIYEPKTRLESCSNTSDGQLEFTIHEDSIPDAVTFFDAYGNNYNVTNWTDPTTSREWYHISNLMVGEYYLQFTNDCCIDIDTIIVEEIDCGDCEDIVADFTYEVTQNDFGFYADVDVELPNSASVISYAWKFGDGEVTTVGTSHVVHHYNHSGTYDVCLVIKILLGDGTLCFHKFCKVVEVDCGSSPFQLTHYTASNAFGAEFLGNYAGDKIWNLFDQNGNLIFSQTNPGGSPNENYFTFNSFNPDWELCFGLEGVSCENCRKLSDADISINARLAVTTFPNPALDHTTISLENLDKNSSLEIDFIIVNELGIPVGTETSVLKGELEKNINVSFLKSGIYSIIGIDRTTGANYGCAKFFKL